jgi:hypothetical protein
MFPNVRLMIVAISASLLAIGCAMSLFLGMFAAFNVAHEPFSALPAKPPLQIAFGEESSAPVVDGRPSPFGIRFQLNAPQTPSGPVIVAVPAALDRTTPPDTAAAPGPAASVPDDAAAPAQDVTTTGSVQPAPAANAKPDETKPADPKQADTKPSDASGIDVAKLENKSENTAENSKDKANAAIKDPAPSSAQNAPHPIAPEIRIVAREADNPASVATAPAPTLAHKAAKRRKLAVHLHQSHHFRRPRIHAIASGETAGYSQPNGYVQPGFPTVTGYAQPHAAYVPQSGFAQPGFQFTPTALRPRARWHHAAATQ